MSKRGLITVGYRTFCRGVAVLCLLAAAATSIAETDALAPQYARHLFGLASGLPEQTVQSIAQTSDHYLWIGTTGGLARFDGTHFVIFDRENTPALQANSIFCLLAARDGSLWIGTEGSGLLRYSHGVFQTFGNRDGLTDLFVRALAQDADGNVWIGTNNGLFRLSHPSSATPVERVDARGTLPPLAINAIFQDSQRRLWLGGSRLLILEHGAFRFLDLPGDRALNRVKSIAETTHGVVWVGTVSGLYRFGPGATAFMQLPEVRGTARALRATADGQLWLSVVGQGIVVLRPDAAGEVSSRTIIPADAALSIFEDVEHNVWLGTETGLLRLTRTPMSVLALPQPAASDFGTTYLDRSGNLWCASTQLFRLKDGAFTRIQLPGLRGSRVRNVLQAADGSYWFGTDGAGVFHMMGTTMRHFTAADGLVNNFIRAMLQARDGSLWFGTDEGVSHFDGQTFHNFGMAQGLAYQSIRSMLQDHSGDVWIGTELGLSHLHNDTFVSDAAVNGLRQDKVWALHEDEDGLWIGTRNSGLYRLRAGLLSHFGTADGLAADSIYDIEEGPAGTFWLSGPAGISQVKRSELDSLADHRPQRLSLSFFGTSSETTATQIFGGMQPAGAITPEGDVWFPSNRGPIRIHPSEALTEQPPPVEITKVVVDGREVPVPDGIHLSPGDNHLEISYSAVMLRSQDSLRFRYKLDGLDTDWVWAGKRHLAEYTNMHAGDYTFHVEAYDLSHPDAVATSSISFRKAPHFYATWWFVFLCLFGAGALAYAIYRSRIARLRRRFQAVLEERSRVAREVHDTLLQGCAGISVLLEAISTLREEDTGLRSSLLDTARTQMRSTMNEAREAIWSLRHEPEAMQDLTSLMKHMGTQLSTDLGVDVRCTVQGEPFQVSRSFAHELLMVVREAVHNAANHAHPNRVDLNLGYASETLSVNVIDDGCGFSPAETPEDNGHFGLIGMRERILRLGGTFRLQSAPAIGTTIAIHVPRRAGSLRRAEAGG